MIAQTFVEENEIIERLGITHFIDDKDEILEAPLCAANRFCLGVDDNRLMVSVLVLVFM